VVPTADNPEQSDHLWSMIETYEDEMRLILKNDWQLIINKTNVPFLTSDDPLLQQLVKNDPLFKEPYLKNYFALTPTLLVHSKPLVGNYVNLTRATVTDEDLVHNVNRLTWNNAQRFVISKENKVLVPPTC
jgi:hypothetical protein